MSGAETRTYRIARAQKCDDVLEARGLYFRTRACGGLIFFSGDGVGMGTYPPGDWLSVHEMTKRDDQ